MKINISKLTHERGLSIPLSWDLDASDFNGTDTRTHFEGRFLLNGQLIHLDHGAFRLEADITMPYRAECDRCLSEVHRVLEFNVQELFTSVRSQALAESQFAEERQDRKRINVNDYDVELDVDTDVDWEEDESFTYHGRTIDFRDAVEQLLILAMPNRILCRETCKGLCSECGQNWNEGSCGCQDEADGDNPFAKLKNLL